MEYTPIQIFQKMTLIFPLTNKRHCFWSSARSNRTWSNLVTQPKTETASPDALESWKKFQKRQHTIFSWIGSCVKYVQLYKITV